MKTSPPNKYLRRIAKSVLETDDSHGVEGLVKRFRVEGENLESLAQRLGVAEIARKRLPFEGAVSIDPNRRVVITINSLSHPLRQRFTLAHEIGHLMLWEMLQKVTHCGVDRDLERASDAIAAELLLPKQGVLSYVRTLDGPSPGNLRLVARTFEVSLQSAALRLCSDLRIWSRSFGLWEYGDRRNQSVRAPMPSDPSAPHESWFVGKRRWRTKRPPFRAFSEALNSSGVVLAHESYFEGGVMRPVGLEVLHLGRGRILAAVQ